VKLLSFNIYIASLHSTPFYGVQLNMMDVFSSFHHNGKHT